MKFWTLILLAPLWVPIVTTVGIVWVLWKVISEIAVLLMVVLLASGTALTRNWAPLHSFFYESEERVAQWKPDMWD